MSCALPFVAWMTDHMGGISFADITPHASFNLAIWSLSNPLLMSNGMAPCVSCPVAPVVVWPATAWVKCNMPWPTVDARRRAMLSWSFMWFVC